MLFSLGFVKPGVDSSSARLARVRVCQDLACCDSAMASERLKHCSPFAALSFDCLRVIDCRKHEAMSFEEAVLPHLNAAYNLARWLTRNEDDAQDVVRKRICAR